MDADRIVIVGGGLAGATAATTLRAEGFTGEVILLAGENEVPYIRPPLSKEFLAGDAARDAGQVHPAGWYAQHDVDLRLGTTVTALDVAGHAVDLSTGERLGYDQVLLATGSSPRRFPTFPEFAGVHYLRTIADSESLRAALAGGGRRVVIVGAGWIGLEVAAAARGHGNQVTVLGIEEIPLERVLGPQLGRYVGDVHRRNGVELRMGTSTAGFEQSDGRISGVRLGDGTLVAADVVVVGVGAVPNTSLAEGAGLPVDNGILVDAGLSAGHGVFAAGDVANAFHPVLGRHLRVEHWANAQWQGEAAGRALLGRLVSYDRVPYFYTDQFDLSMEFSGYGPLMPDARVVLRGDPASGEFLAFWVTGPDDAARVVAGMNVNVWEVHDAISALVASARPVEVARLRQAGLELGEV